MLLLPKDLRCLCQSNSHLLVGFKLTVCNAMQAGQSLKEKKKKFKLTRILKSQRNLRIIAIEF